MLNRSILFISILVIGISCKEEKKNFSPENGPVAQSAVPRVDAMPNEPQPYQLRDWKKTTQLFDQYVFDWSATGPFMPLIWEDTMKRNVNQKTFGLFTCIGDVRQGAAVNNGENHEALGQLGAIIGATLVGIDKSNQDGRNYVKMSQNYFNKDNGWNIIQNFTNKGAHVGGGYGNDYWYDIYNNVLFYGVANYYPKTEGNDEILRVIADQFYKSAEILDQNYSYSYFDFKEMKGGVNHIPTQEDAAGGYAFVLYSAYVKFGDAKYLEAAKKAMNALQSQKESRFYESLMPFGAYIGARLNAEQGSNYEVQKFIDWTFDGDATNREGWGVIVGKWGGYDVSGMVGSTVHQGGYGFAMNTFDLAWPLTAMLRYDQRYARAVGKWALNAANTARLFYPSEIPDSLQALPNKKALAKEAIAYEGLIKESNYPQYKGKTPFAQGDGPQWVKGMPEESMFSLYGSGHVGFFGGLIGGTNVDKILKIDCVAADMFRASLAYPTYLYYNPYKEAKSVEVDLGDSMTDVYDAVGREILMRDVKGKVSVAIPADAARLLVSVPAGAAYTAINGHLLANGVEIDYRYPTPKK